MTLPNWITRTVRGIFAKRRHPITKSRGYKLQLETLEDRVVPSANTLYVGTASDFSSTVPGSTTSWTPGANYAGFTPVSTLTFDTGVATPNTSTAFTNLQHALNQAAADYAANGSADTIKVAPGTYTNDYDITSPVSLYGSNVYYNGSTPLNPAPSSYNTGDPEATVIQTPGSPSPGGAVYNDAFRVLSSSVFIRGFLINGSTAGDDGISNLDDNGHTVQVNSVTIQNNIIQNFAKSTGFGATGIYMDNADPGTSAPDPTKASTGITIAHNYFAHAGAAPSLSTAGAINLDDNLFATVDYNTINVNADSNATSVGIEVSNYNTAGIAGTQGMSIADNYITVGQDTDGVFINGFGQSSNAVSLYLTGNSIQAASGVTPSGLGSTYGTSIKGIQAGALITEQDTIGTMGGQLDRGIDVWDTASGSFVIYYSTVGTTAGTPAPLIGVDLHDVDAFTGASPSPVFVSITGSTITGTTYGLDVTAQNVNATANIGNATGPTYINGVGTASGAGIGINLDGIGATASANNGTANNPSNVTGQNAGLQTTGSTSTTGLVKTFVVTGSHSAGNFCNVMGSTTGSGPVTATASTTSAGTLTVTAGNGATVTLVSQSSPALPGGVTIVNGMLSSGAGVLSAGTHTLTFVQNSSPAVYLTVTFMIDAPPTISAPASVTAHTGIAGSFAVTGTGTPAPTLTMTELSGPPLPVGVSFTGTTGQFYWPSYMSAANDGTYVLKFTATNGLGSVSTTVTWTVVTPQLLAGPANLNPNAPALTQSQLTPVVNAAILMWEQAGISQAQVAQLRATSISIGKISAFDELGDTSATGKITIDATADGDGWYISADPFSNAGFTQIPGTSEYVAKSGPASTEVDLLTVVLHEMGHILGLNDLDPNLYSDTLMTETLSVGVRRLPISYDAAIALQQQDTASAKIAAAQKAAALNATTQDM